MESISEPKPLALIYSLVPPCVCIIQYIVALGALALAVLAPSDMVFRVVAAMFLSIALVMIPFWYRTFWDKHFVGLDRPLVVEWSRNVIWFRGAFFDIEVPVGDVVAFHTIGFRRLRDGFMLKVSTRRDGRVTAFYLSTTMRQKERLVAFLSESAGQNRP